jgi:hypothetical protein
MASTSTCLFSPARSCTSFNKRVSKPGNSPWSENRPGVRPVIVATPLSFVTIDWADWAAGAAAAFGSTAGVTVTFAFGMTAPVWSTTVTRTRVSRAAWADGPIARSATNTAIM